MHYSYKVIFLYKRSTSIDEMFIVDTVSGITCNDRTSITSVESTDDSTLILLPLTLSLSH